LGISLRLFREEGKYLLPLLLGITSITLLRAAINAIAVCLAFVHLNPILFVNG
jgi:hypothetical protein